MSFPLKKFVSRHVVFVKSQLPFQPSFSASVAVDLPGGSPNVVPSEMVEVTSVLGHLLPIPPPQPTARFLPSLDPASQNLLPSPANSSRGISPANFSHRTSPVISYPDDTQHTLPPTTSIHPMKTRSQNNIFKPNPKYSLTVSNSHDDPKPTSHTQALKDPRWRAAMSTEFDALLRNGTWDLVSLALSQNLVGCKWVFVSNENLMTL